MTVRLLGGALEALVSVKTKTNPERVTPKPSRADISVEIGDWRDLPHTVIVGPVCPAGLTDRRKPSLQQQTKNRVDPMLKSHGMGLVSVESLK